MHHQDTKRIVLTLVAMLFVSYGLYQMHDAIWGSNFKLANDMTTVDSIYTLEGRAPKTQLLVVNGRDISVDTEGAFKEPIVLLPGYNVITVARTDFFKNTKTQTVTLYYKPETHEAVALGAPPPVTTGSITNN